MSTLELLQLQNEHKVNTFFEKGEDAAEEQKAEDAAEEQKAEDAAEEQKAEDATEEQ